MAKDAIINLPELKRYNNRKKDSLPNSSWKYLALGFNLEIHKFLRKKPISIKNDNDASNFDHKQLEIDIENDFTAFSNRFNNFPVQKSTK